MLVFPMLRSGAITQYPTSQFAAFSNEVFRFMDGSEQRYRLCTHALRRWIIHLDLLTEQEMDNLLRFIDEAQGSFGHFSFTDPWQNKNFPDCSFEEDTFVLHWNSVTRGSGTLNIRENYSSTT